MSNINIRCTYNTMDTEDQFLSGGNTFAVFIIKPLFVSSCFLFCSSTKLGRPFWNVSSCVSWISRGEDSAKEERFNKTMTSNKQDTVNVFFRWIFLINTFVIVLSFVRFFCNALANGWEYRLLRKTRKQRIDDYVYELYKLDNTSFVIYVIENFLNRTFEILKYENTYETYEIWYINVRDEICSKHNFDEVRRRRAYKIYKYKS